MKKIIAVFGLIAIILVIRACFRRPPAVEAPAPGAGLKQEPAARQADRVPLQAGEAAPVLSPVQLKLDRLYSAYVSSPNPGYSNVLDAVLALALYDPTTTDLYKDACTFVSLRTELADLERQFADHRQDLLKWTLAHTALAERARVKARFEAEVAPEILELRQADDGIKRVFQERFSAHHGLNGDAAVVQLSLLTLTNTGPELWIRCDENVSPYPEVPTPVYQVIPRPDQ